MAIVGNPNTVGILGTVQSPLMQGAVMTGVQPLEPLDTYVYGQGEGEFLKTR